MDDMPVGSARKLTDVPVGSARKLTDVPVGSARKLTDLVVDGGRIHAEETGAGEAVLLLHAGVTDRRVWDPIAPALAAAGFRAIRYDQRGHGRSPAPSAPHSQVADAIAVLDAAGVDTAHFVGLSQGAATSVDAALAHPTRVRSLTLVAPGLTGYRWPRLPGFARRMAAAEAGDAHRLAVETARLWAPMSFADGNTTDTDALCDGPHDAAGRIILDQAEQFLRDDLAVDEPYAVDRLAEIAAPTLVVLGDRDVAPISDIGHLLTAGIPGARGTIVADADHMLPLRTPEQFVELLLTHLGAAP
jgi:pimeloyl-ACP methyl ester carboxylesterase